MTLDEEVRLQAADLTHREAKILFRYHRNVQIVRIAASQCVYQLERERIEPSELFAYFRRNAAKLERQTNATLQIYVDQNVATRWMRDVGVGVAQSVGIYTLIDIEKVGKYVSSLWRFAGYDPSVVKLTKKEAGECVRYFQDKYKKDYVDLEMLHYVAIELNRGVEQLKRITKLGMYRKEIMWWQLYKAIMSYPWCNELKEVLYRVGVSFRRMGGRGAVISPYRSIYDWRKAYEVERNEQGHYTDQAEHKLVSRRYKRNTVARKCYEEGKLPPEQIDARARRFAVKIFLVHLHQVLYYERYGKMPPKPYVLDVLGKEREIICPKWPFRNS